MTFDTNIITAIAGGGAIGGILTAAAKTALAYIQSSQDLEEEADAAADRSNKTLRELLDDQDRKIGQLEEQVKQLESQVAVLTQKNTTMEAIFSAGLVLYFEKHPSQAQALKRSLKTT